MADNVEFEKHPELVSKCTPETGIHNIVVGSKVNIGVVFNSRLRRYEDCGFGVRYRSVQETTASTLPDYMLGGGFSTSAENIREKQRKGEERNHSNQMRVLKVSNNFPRQGSMVFEPQEYSRIDIFSRYHYFEDKNGRKVDSWDNAQKKTWDEIIRWRFVVHEVDNLVVDDEEKVKKIIVDMLSLYTLGQIGKQVLNYLRKEIDKRDDSEEILRQTKLDEHITDDSE